VRITSDLLETMSELELQQILNYLRMSQFYKWKITLKYSFDNDTIINLMVMALCLQHCS
jgi:hypothetical protein